MNDMRSKYKEDNPFARLHTEIASKEKRSPWDELLKAVLPKSTPVAKAAAKLQAHARGARARRLSREALPPSTPFEDFLAADVRKTQEEEPQQAVGPIMETLMMNQRRQDIVEAPSAPWSGRALGAELDEAAKTDTAEVQAATSPAARPMQECPECGGPMLPDSPESADASVPQMEPPEQPLRPPEVGALAETVEEHDVDDVDDVGDVDDVDDELKEVMGTPSQLEATDDEDAEAGAAECYSKPLIFAGLPLIYSDESSTKFLDGPEEEPKPAADAAVTAGAAPNGWARRLVVPLLLLTLGVLAATVRGSSGASAISTPALCGGSPRCAAVVSAALPSWWPAASSPQVAPPDLPETADCSVASLPSKQLVQSEAGLSRPLRCTICTSRAAADTELSEPVPEADSTPDKTVACQATRGGPRGRPWHAQLNAAVATNWLHKLARLG